MSMHRTIFEVPVSIKDELFDLLSQYPLSFQITPAASAPMLELEITHGKNQAYLIELIEAKINTMAEEVDKLPN